MKIGTLKGALLEYIIRNLLKNCGFTNVREDKIYTYEKGGLFFINGKGAAHDADVAMNPPIQMPFHYPTRLVFECKAYKDSAGLPIVRNALGLRNDINDFEIVTKKSIKKRQNNKRANYAIKTRNRYLYQIGVASINKFTKPAIEFATNNKIPLLSLSWFFSSEKIEEINSLNQDNIDAYEQEELKNTKDYFKDREASIHDVKYEKAKKLLGEENELASIVRFAELVVKYSYVGLLETGDMVFLFADSRDNILANTNSFKPLFAEYHWSNKQPNLWELDLRDEYSELPPSRYKFYLPDRLLNYWDKFNRDKGIALNMKQMAFSKLFVFNSRNSSIPFSVINLDAEWFNRAKEDLGNQREN